MTADEAVEIAKAHGTSQGCRFDDHTIEAKFVTASNLNILNPTDDVWHVSVIYNPLKGIALPYCIEVNCRTGKATLIKTL